MKNIRNLYWATMFGELEAFVEHCGHFRVNERRMQHPELTRWWRGVQTRLERLNYQQILNLDRLGFFGQIDGAWLDRYVAKPPAKTAAGALVEIIRTSEVDFGAERKFEVSKKKTNWRIADKGAHERSVAAICLFLVPVIQIIRARKKPDARRPSCAPSDWPR